jgi:acylphosphatase
VVRIHLIITGRVQGVGFRMFVQRAAKQHRITGFTKNLPDGTVKIEAQGTPESVKTFQLEVSMGPVHSHVEKVERTTLELQSSEESFNVS